MKATLDLPGEAAMGLVAQVVEVDFVDEPTHAAMEFASGRGRVVNIRAPENTNAAMLQAANDRFLFDLVAREAIEPFEEHHLENGRPAHRQEVPYPVAGWPPASSRKARRPRARRQPRGATLQRAPGRRALDPRSRSRVVCRSS